VAEPRQDPGRAAHTSALRTALDDVAGVGPFFAASANPAEVVDDSWRPLRELYTEPGPLAARITQVARALGDPESRVAASIAHQGLAARLVSPLVAVASVHGLVPPWSPDTLHWRPAVTGPWPLWESAGDESTAHPGQDAEVVAAVVEVLVGPHLAALVDAVRSAARTVGGPGGAPGQRTLWGNTASALVAAARMVAAARPGAAGRARRVVVGLLEAGPLAGAGDLGGGWGFRRRSCCLYYRVPGGGLCGDCVLTGRRPRSADR
jgi:ferric iron reductase protein FhuF